MTDIEQSKYSEDVLTVSELTRRVTALLKSGIGRVWVSGEISNLRTPQSGHMYFTLKDQDSQMSAVMFNGRNRSLRFRPQDGIEVMVRGSVTIFAPRGQYQIIVDRMEPRGAGALQIAFEQLKKKLDQEGLFDPARKKPIPAMPRRIGLVTSPTGAAIRDILSVIRRRFSGVHLVLYPVRVQGAESPAEVVAGIEALDSLGDIDVMIIGRGGGSIEDLWAFNDERVARAVYACATPIISAVGHEIDFTISDFVADLRAATPSAAAELVVGERDAMRNDLEQVRRRLRSAARHAVERAENKFYNLQQSYVLQRPEDILRDRQQRLDEMTETLHTALNERIVNERNRLRRMTDAVRHLRPAATVARNRDRLTVLARRLATDYAHMLTGLRSRQSELTARLDGLSPLGVLARGYSLVRRVEDGSLVVDAACVDAGDRLDIQFHRGRIVATVDEPVAG